MRPNVSAADKAPMRVMNTKFNPEASDTCLISSTGVSTGKPSKTSKTVSVGFCSGRTSA
jgi:hypothetical protein